LNQHLFFFLKQTEVKYMFFPQLFYHKD
jgi:hypothetical protein